MTPSAAPYEDHVRAYGTVLDLANLTTLNTTYVSAVSQLNTAQAKLAASQPAYARAQALYAKDVGSLAQMQTTEAAVLGDKASVAAAQSQVRTLAATALQEWGPVIGRALVASAGLVNRLIERRGVSAADHAAARAYRSIRRRRRRSRSEAARAASTCATSRRRRGPIRRSRA